jgi:hypothetical protein
MKPATLKQQNARYNNEEQHRPQAYRRPAEYLFPISHVPMLKSLECLA